jgi:hypothetical protein
MHSASRRAILWAESPAFVLAGSFVFKARHAPSAPRLAHRLHHRAVNVRGDVRDSVRDAVRGKSLPECSFWAAGARPIRIPGRAAALMLRKAATGLRALGLKPASLLRIAQASLPVPRSHRAPAGQGQNQNLKGGYLRIGLRALGHTPFPKTPACAPAPDWRPIPSLRSVISQAASRARFALDPAPHQSRLGTLLPLSLVGTRSCLCRDRLSQRWGASFSLRRLGAAYHGSPALGGLRKLSLIGSEEFLPFSPVARTTCAPRFIEPRNVLARKSVGLRALAHSSLRHRANANQSQFNIFQSRTKPTNKELIKSYAAY